MKVSILINKLKLHSSVVIRIVLVMFCLQLPGFTPEAEGQELLRLTVKKSVKSRKKDKIVRKSDGKDIFGGDGDAYISKEVPGVDVYSFATEGAANKLKNKLQNYERAGKWEGEIARGKTNRQGWVELKVTSDGYVLVDFSDSGDEDGAKVVKVSALKSKIDDQGVFNAEYVAVLNVQELGESEVRGRDLRKRSSTMSARRSGKKMTFRGTAYVDSAYARSGARFGLLPRLVLPHEGGKEIDRFTPEVLDGKEYHEKIYERRGFDRNNDKLAEYVNDNFFMEDNKDASWQFTHVIDPFDVKRYYNCVGYEWYEDFDNVYHEGSRIIWPGRWTEYNAFINWDDAKMDLDVDTMRYRIDSKTNLSSKNDAFHLQFKVGSDELDETDSLTMEEYERLISLIDKYYRGIDGSQIKPLTIKAYASPEGNENSNRALAQRRAHFLQRRLLERYTDRSRFAVPKTVTSDVVKWTEVADTLDRRGENGDEQAKSIVPELREIIAKHKSLDAQYAAIRGRAWYSDYILPKVLPQMRRCEFEYQAVVHKILSPEENMEKYEEYRKKGTLMSLHNYQYYHVMRQLADQHRWPELEELALLARKSSDCSEQVVRHDLDTTIYHTTDFTKWCEDFKEQHQDSLQQLASVKGLTIDDVFEVGDIQTVKSEPYTRPYPLASYYLVLARLRQSKVDLRTLEDYFDFYNQGYEGEYKDFDQIPWGWWNDEAFVVLQTMVCCLDDDYTKALKVMGEHLKDDPKYRRLRVFIRCLNGTYDDKEIIDTVANSSPMNAVAIYVAQEKKDYYQRALNVIEGRERREAWSDDMVLDTADARVLYLQAVCNYKIQVKDQSEEGPLPLESMVYSEDEGPTDNLVAPLFESFRRNPEMYKFFQHDGLFPTPFHIMVDYFWKRMQDGVKITQIIEEYRQLKPLYKRNG